MDSRRHFLGKVSGLAGTLAVAPDRVLGANERIRVGLIGAGDRGIELIHQIRACPNTEIAAVTDIYSVNLARVSRLLPGAHICRDLQTLLLDPAINAIVIATPPHVHAEAFCAALDANKHVYVEKTIAHTVAHAKRMRDAVRSDGGAHVVQVGHQACSFGQITDVKQFLADPARLGRITGLAMRSHRNVPNGKLPWARAALLTADVNAENVDWAAFSGDTAERELDAHRFIHWRYFPEYSGGSVTENMSQQLAFWYKALDLQIPRSATMTGGAYVTGSPAKQAAGLSASDGRCENPDTVHIAFVQPEEMLLTWSSGFGNSHLGVGEDLLGSAGTISRTNQVRYIPQKINRPEGAEILGRIAHVPHAHMQDFFDSIRASRNPNGSFEVGFRVAVACQMALESYRQARTVRWDTTLEEIV